MTIWQFNYAIAKRLHTFNIINLLLGVLAAFAGPFWRGVGSQAVGWSIINLGIARFGRKQTARRFTQAEEPYQPDVMDKESRNLRRLLLVNVVIFNPLYIAGGWRYARNRDSQFQQGIGWGIVLQGVFLFFFDLFHVLNVPRGKR